MREITVYAPAKLNLYLDVLDKRPDGYHNIKTLFEKIDLKDKIIIKERPKGSELLVKTEPYDVCPQGQDNIVYKAIAMVFEEADVSLDIEVVIKKKIPVSAGLGGGSSDAASAMRAVNDIFELGISPDRLCLTAGAIGKDVPFFMTDTAFAIGSGTGETIESIDTNTAFIHLLVQPEIGFSTIELYKALDKGRRNMAPKADFEELLRAIERNDRILLEQNYYNAFEEVSLRDHRYSFYIDKIKAILLDRGVGKSLLSGSGPTVFCTFDTYAEAEEIARNISKAQGVRVFLAATYKGGIYGNK